MLKAAATTTIMYCFVDLSNNKKCGLILVTIHFKQHNICIEHPGRVRGWVKYFLDVDREIDYQGGASWNGRVVERKIKNACSIIPCAYPTQPTQ